MRVLIIDNIIDNELDSVEVVSVTFTLRRPEADLIHAVTGVQGLEFTRQDHTTDRPAS